MTRKTAAQLRHEYLAKTKSIVDRLQELSDDDLRAAQGLNRNIPPAQVERERADLVRQFEHLDSASRAEAMAWLDESRAELARVRAQPVGDDQARMVDLLEADAMARQGRDASAILAEAAAMLNLGDTRAAKVRLDAARLAANGKPLRGVDRVATAIERELDRTVPARQEAISAHRMDILAAGDAELDRLQTRQVVAQLAGNASRAARSSAAAKLKAYDQAKAKGEEYQQHVDMAPIGEPKIGVSYPNGG